MEMKRRALVVFSVVTLLACYAATLRGMFDQWSTDEDMGHGFVVPFVVLWIVWRERERWRALPLEPSWWGLAILATGAGMHFVSALGAGLFAGSVGFLVSVVGVVVCLAGFAWLRVWALPLLLALFMLPKLAVVYNQATLPLQLLASRLAAGMLTATGAAVIREGNILDVGGHRIAVEEACNGIRYLLPLCFTGVVFAYLADAKPWMRVALLAAAVPIAIAANAFRVAAAGSWPRLAEGALHSLEGWIIFVLCLAMLALVRRLCNAAYALYHA
jgi:exosortase